MGKEKKGEHESVSVCVCGCVCVYVGVLCVQSFWACEMEGSEVILRG